MPKMNVKEDKQSEKPEHWYVVLTKYNCEKKVQQSLNAHGYKTFLPVYSTIRQWSDRKKKVILPLINSVVFIQIAPSLLNELYSFNNIKGILKDQNKPAIVRDYEINNLRIITKEWNGEVISENSNNESLDKGDNVEVLRGPFAGIYGELLDVNGKHRVIVRLESMNVEFVINVPLNAVKKYEKMDNNLM